MIDNQSSGDTTSEDEETHNSDSSSEGEEHLNYVR